MSSLQDKYSLGDKISKNIIKAEDKSTKIAAIIKKVSFSSISPKKKQHIVNQVNTLVRMDYVHILRYLDFCINKKDLTVDIAMEYCQGGSLTDLIMEHRSKGKKISQDLIWRVFYQLAQAIDYIHMDNLIHRNLNPSNIYFKESQRQNIKLGGFNLSKRIDLEQILATTVLPNTHYISPEQIQSGICSRETDVWALGCLIYELCTLQTPFKQANEFERAKMIKESRPKKTGYSLQLNRVIFWCLSKDPEARPTLNEILRSPEIDLRIRERRFNQRHADLLAKEESIQKREKALLRKQEELQQQRGFMNKCETLRKKNSTSFRNPSFLKNTN